MAEINQTKCDLAFQISYHPIYRLAQFWTLSVSLLAVPSLLYFLLKRVLLLPFHGNLKCLLITYFSSIFLYALVLCFDFVSFFFEFQCLHASCQSLQFPLNIWNILPRLWQLPSNCWKNLSSLANKFTETTNFASNHPFSNTLAN